MQINEKVKKKIYLSSKKIDIQLASSQIWITDFFEFIEANDEAPHLLLKKKFDIIELYQEDFTIYKNLLGSINWRQNKTGVADILFLKDNIYFPLHLISDCILKLIKTNYKNVNFARTVMVIGTFDFVLPVVVKLALAGFSNLVVALTQPERSKIIEKKINEFIFNVKINFVHLNEITQIEGASSVLISNLTSEMEPDAYESLTYFNFLSNGALFVDFQSNKDQSLAEEARRAELSVIEESEILTLKYQTLIDFYKNSSFV